MAKMEHRKAAVEIVSAKNADSASMRTENERRGKEDEKRKERVSPPCKAAAEETMPRMEPAAANTFPHTLERCGFFLVIKELAAPAKKHVRENKNPVCSVVKFCMKKNFSYGEGRSRLSRIFRRAQRMVFGEGGSPGIL